MKNRTTLIGVLAVSAALLTGLWLVKRKDVERLPTQVQKAPVPAASGGQVPTANGPDYRANFERIWSSEWLLLEPKIDNDEFLCDPSYCENYLIWCVSVGELDWGRFLAQSRLNPASKARFIELVAQKKLATKQAIIAARALAPEVGKNGRSDLLASVGAEYDEKIKEVVSEDRFSLFQAGVSDELLTLLEPFFAEAGSMGLALTDYQERDMLGKLAANLRSNPHGRQGVWSAFLGFDPASDESVALSLDQVIVFRDYQNAMRVAYTPTNYTKSKHGTESGAEFAVRQWSIGNFCGRLGKEWELSTSVIDTLSARTNDLLARRITSEEYAKVVTALLGAEKLQKLIDIATKTALEREIWLIQQKLHVLGMTIGAAENKKLGTVLEFWWREPATSKVGSAATLKELDLRFLPEEMRALIERHLRGSLAARSLYTTIEARETVH